MLDMRTRIRGPKYQDIVRKGEERLASLPLPAPPAAPPSDSGGST